MESCLDFVAILKVCAKQRDICTGTTIHSNSLKWDLLTTNMFVGSSLVNMYVKCGKIQKAQQVFDELPVQDAVSWNALLTGYAELGHGEKALSYFEALRCQGYYLDAITYCGILKACSCCGATEKGKEIHCEIIKRGWLDEDMVLGTALVDMYAKCGEFAKALQAFDQLPVRDIVSWNALITGYTHHGHMDLAFDCLTKMMHDGLLPNAVTLAGILKACSSIGALKEGVEVHDIILRAGMHRKDDILATALVDMYAKCGVLTKAQEIFDEISVRDEVAWGALCTGYCQHYQNETVLKCFKHMKIEGISPGESTFAASLKACASLKAAEEGVQMHAEIVKEGFEKSSLLGNGLVDMYVKCGSLVKAEQVVNELPVHTAASWNALMAGYAERGSTEKVLMCLEMLQDGGLTPDSVTFLSILKSCGSFEIGMLIHVEIARLGFKDNIMLGSALVDYYSKYGAPDIAQAVFQELPFKDVVSWTALIAGCAHNKEQSSSLFERMQIECISPNSVTFACILKACGVLGTTEQGVRIHARIWEQGLIGDNFMLGENLIDMYGKCGALMCAQKVFDKLSNHDVMSWNALLAGYSEYGKHKVVLTLFEKMIDEDVGPSEATYMSVLKACRYLELLDEAEMHFHLMTRCDGIIPTLEHITCLVEIYGDAGQFESILQVIEVVAVSERLPLWIALLGACQKRKNVMIGQLAFEHALEVDENSVAAHVHMSNIYVAVGQQVNAEKTFVNAQRLFNKLACKDLTSWNALIAGFCEHGRDEEAINCFDSGMRNEGLCPDPDTFLHVLRACGNIGAIQKGKKVHDDIARSSLLGWGGLLGNALVDMYARCGALARAQSVFDELRIRDVVCWTSLIAGYSQHGYAEEALNCFERMLDEGLSPDTVTFTCVLKVCNNVRAVEKGWMCFNAMSEKYGIIPSLEHYTCIVDLLGTAGHFERAVAVIKKMPSDTTKAWVTLLSAAHKGGNVKLGRVAFDTATQSGDKSSGTNAFHGAI